MRRFDNGPVCHETVDDDQKDDRVCTILPEVLGC